MGRAFLVAEPTPKVLGLLCTEPPNQPQSPQKLLPYSPARPRCGCQKGSSTFPSSGKAGIPDGMQHLLERIIPRCLLSSDIGLSTKMCGENRAGERQTNRGDVAAPALAEVWPCWTGQHPG